MYELASRQVVLHDPFWSPRLEVNARTAIFHQWEQLEASGCIENFRIAAGEKNGFREGWFFADSDATKWLDAAARIQVVSPDPKLVALMDSLIALLGRAQDEDGYLFTYNQIHFPGTRWTNLQIEHELYCHGHLIEAGVSHYQATGGMSMLSIACKAADRVVTDFLDGRPEGTPGHEEIEIALLRLYQATGHRPYLDMARRFIERRGRTPFFALSLLRQNTSAEKRKKYIAGKRQEYLAAHPEHVAFRLPLDNISKAPSNSKLRWMLNALSGKYFQQHAPVRRQTVPVGHSVRFGYLETAVARLSRLEGDKSLLPALEKTWERMVSRRMYVTGGIGAVPGSEGFGNDYELDPEYAYAETCASLASLFWNWEMAQLTGEAKYSDLFEWQLNNAAAVGMGLSGKDYLYNNPLLCRGGVTRKAWYAVPCCPSNLSRTWADLGKYIYSFDEENIWIHQYIGSRMVNGSWGMEIDSSLPWEGRVRIKVDPGEPSEFTLHLRIPSWAVAGGFSVNLNGKPILNSSSMMSHSSFGFDPHPSRFLPIQRLWSPGDTIELTFEMPIALRSAHPKVKGHAGKVAVTRGPLVYCLESVDNPGVDLFTCRLDPTSLRSDPAPDLLGGITLLRGQTIDGQPLTFIPYSLWANRGESQMTVWVNT